MSERSRSRSRSGKTDANAPKTAEPANPPSSSCVPPTPPVLAPGDPQPPDQANPPASPASPAPPAHQPGFLLAALQEQWGDEETLSQGPLNLTSVSRQLGKWLEGGTFAHLGEHLDQMRARVQVSTRRMDEQRKKPVEPELASLFEANWRDYSEVDDCLGALQEAWTRQDRELLRPQLLRLRAAIRRLLAGQAALNDWRTRPVPRCPRCGGTAPGQEWTCPGCRLELLYPGRGGGQPPLGLPGPFKAVYDACTAVVRGELGLHKLGPTLTPLRKLLQTQVERVRWRPGFSEEARGPVEALGEALREGLQGIAILEAVPKTRRTQDLHEGWRLLQQAAAELARLLPALARAAGVEYGEDARDSILLQERDH